MKRILIFLFFIFISFAQWGAWGERIISGEVPFGIYPGFNISYSAEPSIITSPNTTIFVTYTIDPGNFEPMEEVEKEMKMDVIFVLDRSNSMSDEDYPPSRLEAAKSAISDIVNKLDANDRIGIVAFNTNAMLVSPLTTDHQSALGSMSAITPDGGTGIGAGIKRAKEELLNNGRNDSLRAMILLSDGANNNPPDPVSEADSAYTKGFVIYTIGVGSSSPTTQSSLDEETLLQIAQATGGEYFLVTNYSLLIDRMEKIKIEMADIFATGVNFRYHPQYYFESNGSLIPKIFLKDKAQIITINGTLLTSAPEGQIPLIIGQNFSYFNRLTNGSGSMLVPDISVYNSLPGSFLNMNVSIHGKSDYSFPVFDISQDVNYSINTSTSKEVSNYVYLFPYDLAQMPYMTTDFYNFTNNVSKNIRSCCGAGAYLFNDRAIAAYDNAFFEDEVFIVFEKDNSTPWISLDEVRRNPVGSLPGYAKTERMDEQIVSVAAKSIGNTKDMRQAAYLLSHRINHRLINYSGSETHRDSETASEILDKGKGWCMDFSVLYSSLVTSLNIPVRGITFSFRKATHFWPDEKDGHAINEVFVDGQWIHVEPQGKDGSAFNNPDAYIKNGWKEIEVKEQKSPKAIKEVSMPLTLKYSVGALWPKSKELNKVYVRPGNTIKKKVKIVNRAQSTQVFGLFGEEKNRAVNISISFDDKDNIISHEEKNYSLFAGDDLYIPIEISLNNISMDQTNIGMVLEYYTPKGDKFIKRYSILVVKDQGA
jgi:Ca-activated chloride channel family protein